MLLRAKQSFFLGVVRSRHTFLFCAYRVHIVSVKARLYSFNFVKCCNTWNSVLTIWRSHGFKQGNSYVYEGYGII